MIIWLGRVAYASTWKAEVDGSLVSSRTNLVFIATGQTAFL